MGTLHNVMLTGRLGGCWETTSLALDSLLRAWFALESHVHLMAECSDVKAKARAVEAGVAYGLARALSAKLPESHTIPVR